MLIFLQQIYISSFKRNSILNLITTVFDNTFTTTFFQSALDLILQNITSVRYKRFYSISP